MLSAYKMVPSAQKKTKVAGVSPCRILYICADQDEGHWKQSCRV
jgi:hypothetical protein